MTNEVEQGGTSAVLCEACRPTRPTRPTQAHSPTWLACAVLSLACASCDGCSASHGESGDSAAGERAPQPTRPVDPPTVPAAHVVARPGVFAAASDVPPATVPSPAEDTRFACGAMGHLPLAPPAARFQTMSTAA